MSWQPVGKVVYIGADGDDMGSHVARFILRNDLKSARKLSLTIHRGEAAIEKYAARVLRGRFVIAGGDDMLIRAPASTCAPDSIEKMRALYQRVTGGHTITVGVGETMEDASKALTIGKNTGKNKTVYWTPDKQPLYKKLVAARCNALITKCREQGGLPEARRFVRIRVPHLSE